MSLIYTEEDYHGVVDDNYRRYSFFSDRGIEFGNRWGGFQSNTILIAGCGWGFLVEQLMAQEGFTDVWGVDASEYSVNTAAPRELPQQYANRIILGNITSDSSIRSVADAAGIRGGNPRFRGILTEDVLPCMEDMAELQQALTVLRARSQTMAHIITPMMSDGERQPDGSVNAAWKQDGPVQMPGFLWLSQQEWIDAIGPGEPIMFTDSTEVVNI